MVKRKGKEGRKEGRKEGKEKRKGRNEGRKQLDRFFKKSNMYLPDILVISHLGTYPREIQRLVYKYS